MKFTGRFIFGVGGIRTGKEEEEAEPGYGG